MSETLTSPKTSSASPSPHIASGFEMISLIVFIAIALVIAGLVSLDTGWTGIGLFVLGGLLGGVFLGFQYGFASAWRRALVHGEMMGISK
ncbi:MAG: YeeE/YedE family protein, partial [Candidatus Puniceispirillaceae bacterium]